MADFLLPAASSGLSLRVVSPHVLYANVVAGAVSINCAEWDTGWIWVPERLSSPAGSVLLALITVEILDCGGESDEFY